MVQSSTSMNGGPVARACTGVLVCVLLLGACAPGSDPMELQPRGDGAGLEVRSDTWQGGAGDAPRPGGPAPTIEVRRGAELVAAGGLVALDGAGRVSLRVMNRGDADLVIRAIELESTQPAAFALISDPAPSARFPIVLAPHELPHVFEVHFDPTRVGSGPAPIARVALETNTTADGQTRFELLVAPGDPRGDPAIEPRVIDFGVVTPGAKVTQLAHIRNDGATLITVSRVWLSGDPGFSLRLGGTEYTASGVSASAGIAIDPPLAIPAAGFAVLDVSYRASHGDAAWGTLGVAPLEVAPSHARATLVANASAPCIALSPSRVDFGARLVDQVSERAVTVGNCGERELVIERLYIEDDPAGVFGVITSALGVLPRTVAPGGSIEVTVFYYPVAEAELGREGQPIPDTARLHIDSNANRSTIELSGHGVRTGGCPTAVIQVAEGGEVGPGTLLQLDGAGSSSPNGAIAAWAWSVVQPSGSVSSFSPSASVRDPTFEANVAGTYTFRLSVVDAMGLESCSPAEHVVTVSSEAAIHVELLWHTPGDPDESDTGGGASWSAGSDLDLHFLHPRANGTYFDWTYDCYWENVNPEWGLFGPEDNPRLSRDDSDGAGPEILTLSAPEQSVRYQVGAHYWRDWGYGHSLATIRIYINGVLRDQWAGVRLVVGDMWDSHYIDWPSGAVTRITGAGGGARITPQYPINSGFPF